MCVKVECLHLSDSLSGATLSAVMCATSPVHVFKCVLGAVACCVLRVAACQDLCGLNESRDVMWYA